MFATITPLLMTGSFADRMTFKSWIIFCVAWEILVYYPLAHWIWGKGWLSPFGDIITRKGEGVIDFAGGIVIHTSAGTGAFVGALILGKRRGFVEYNYGKFPMSSLPLSLVGVCFLWLGWFGFNAGSALSSGTTTAIAVINTHIAACVSGSIWLFGAWIKHTPSLVETVNGAVAGLAGITPASGFIGVDAALIISVVLGLASFFAVPLLKEKLHVDDALDVTVVHGLTGIIGSFAIGIAASKEYNKFGMNGWIRDNPSQMAQQLLGIAVAMFLGGFWTWAILKILEKTIGIRVSPEVEDAGLDFAEHGELAYETLHKKFDDYSPIGNGNHSQSSKERINIDTELDASM
jgi:Amt family ammonium transporter